MELKDRVVIISKKNFEGIENIYGRCTPSDLERIVNNHIESAIIEINEDNNKNQ